MKHNTGSAENTFLSYLKQQGFKETPERLEILEAVAAFKGHFDAEELYLSMKKRGGKISRATVYRALPLFKESGIIRETICNSERSCYENLLNTEHHDHLLCLRCGKVIEFKDDEIERLQEALCRKYGFTPMDHMMSIRGYCRNCRPK